MEGQVSTNRALRKILLVLSCILMSIGFCGGPLITRLYFLHGGSRIWLAGWLQTCGFPIILILLIISYFSRRKSEGARAKLISVKLSTFIAASVLGVIVGLINYLFSYGVGHLPVSTATLITTSSLIFNAFFAYVLVKHKFTPYSVNAVILLTVGAVVLALQGSKERPEGESKKLYILGFVLTFVGAAVSGVLAPLIEFTCHKTGMEGNFTQVMETQVVLSFSASLFGLVGMLVNNDFKVIPREAREFTLGETKYYVVLVWSAIIWQLYLVGMVGVIFNGSALTSGIIGAALVPISEVLAVIFYHEKFTAEKGVSLALCLWGFVSHFYGQKIHSEKTGENYKGSEKETKIISEGVP